MPEPIELNTTTPLRDAILHGGGLHGDRTIMLGPLLSVRLAAPERKDLALLYAGGDLLSGDGTAAPLLCDGQAASGEVADIAEALKAHIAKHARPLRALIGRMKASPGEFIVWALTHLPDGSTDPRTVASEGNPYGTTVPRDLVKSVDPEAQEALRAVLAEGEARNAAHLELVAEWVANATDEEVKPHVEYRLTGKGPLAAHPKVIARLDALRGRR